METCQRCGQVYETVWDTGDEMWERVTGETNGSGLFCPACFEKMARELDIDLYWECAEECFPSLVARMVSAEETVKIGPMTYTVRYIHGLHSDGDKLNGYIKHNSQEILIEDDMCAESKRQTLWHEIIHGILMQGGFHEHNDRVVEVIAYGLLGVLQGNRWLRE